MEDATDDQQRSLSIFFPAYNEEGAIERTVRDAVAAARSVAGDFEVIVVDDGSADATAGIVEKLAAEDPRVRLVRHPTNRGYGAAIRTGLGSATKDLVFYSDADGQFHLDELPATLEQARSVPVVAGYRIKRSDPWHRLFIARTYRLIVFAVFGLRVRDIDCAWKLFRREALEGLVLESNGAFISSELLIKLRRNGVPIHEVGVHHYPRTTGVSKGATPKVILKTIRDIVRLRLGLPLSNVVLERSSSKDKT